MKVFTNLTKSTQQREETITTDTFFFKTHCVSLPNLLSFIMNRHTGEDMRVISVFRPGQLALDYTKSAIRAT